MRFVFSRVILILFIRNLFVARVWSFFYIPLFYKCSDKRVKSNIMLGFNIVTNLNFITYLMLAIIFTIQGTLVARGFISWTEEGYHINYVCF